MDGAFVLHKLAGRLKRFPKPAEVLQLRDAITQWFPQAELLRTYFYHAEPLGVTLQNPVDNSVLDLQQTDVYRNHRSMIDTLKMADDFAVRLGTVVAGNWKLGDRALASLRKNPREIRPKDMVPDVHQKGVDLRIGLDIARLSLTRAVDAIAVVTGDSDFIPAMKFARREAVRTYLFTLQHGVKSELKEHADRVAELDLDEVFQLKRAPANPVQQLAAAASGKKGNP